MNSDREALQNALERMDRARNVLTNGNPRPECNWGVLDTSDIRAALAASQAAPAPAEVPLPVALSADDVFTVLGQAAIMRLDGKVDMPTYFYGLAERIALTIGDEAAAGRVRSVAALVDANPQAEVAGVPQESEALAQLRHLVDDLTHCPNPDDPTRRYIRPGAGLMFSNMVNAVVSLLATRSQPSAGAERAAQLPDCAACDGTGSVADPAECPCCGKAGCRTIDCPTCNGTGSAGAERGTEAAAPRKASMMAFDAALYGGDWPNTTPQPTAAPVGPVVRDAVAEVEIGEALRIPIIDVLAKWEDENGSLCGVLDSEWHDLMEAVATAAIEQSPRMARAALSRPQAAAPNSFSSPEIPDNSSDSPQAAAQDYEWALDALVAVTGHLNKQDYSSALQLARTVLWERAGRSSQAAAQAAPEGTK